MVLGNSVGGFAAGRLAIRRPELVKGLVLVDAGGFGGRPLYVRAFCALMAKPGFLRRIYPAFSARYMRARTAADRRVRDVGIATTRADPGLRTVAELWASFASPEHDLRAEAALISAPTLVVWGKRDPVIPLRLGRRAVAAISGAELLVLDTGHAPQVSDPEAVAERLIPFAESAFAVGRGQHAPRRADVERSSLALRPAWRARRPGARRGARRGLPPRTGAGARVRARLAGQREPVAQRRGPTRRSLRMRRARPAARRAPAAAARRRPVAGRLRSACWPSTSSTRARRTPTPCRPARTRRSSRTSRGRWRARAPSPCARRAMP